MNIRQQKEKHTENYTIVYADADKTYVALDFVEKYTNIKYKMYKDPNRITVTKTWGTIEQSSVKKGCGASCKRAALRVLF